jgi:hypothetical protein
MMPRSSTVALAITVLLASGCASTTSSGPAMAADRIILTTADGTVLRQSANPNAHMTFAAAPARVWAAVQGSYVDLGIAANTADRSAWRYGVMGYTVPRRVNGAGIASLFSCGSSMTGPLVDQGRLTADVVTTLTPSADSTATDATVYVDGVLRKSDGASSDPMNCASTGRLEEMLRTTISKRLSTP